MLDWVENADGYKRQFTYDALLRPTKVVTTLPKSDPATTQSSASRTFTMKYGYDGTYGRLKAKEFPAVEGTAVGERIVLEYSDRGYAVGETELLPNGTKGKQYRRVRGMSVRAQVTDQVFGNCAADQRQFDASAGVEVFVTALRPSGLAQ